MPRRTIPGIGTADLTPEQDVLARRILADPTRDPDVAVNEVCVLHALAVEVDATPALDEWGQDTWAVEREQARVEQEGVQTEIAA